MKKFIFITSLLISGSLFAATPAHYFGDEQGQDQDQELVDEQDPQPDKTHPKKPQRYPASMQKLYGYKLCQEGDFNCVTVKRGHTWHSLFPNEKQRDIVRRLNRTNLHLKLGQPLAVPNNLDKISVLDVAPFERKIDTHGKKLIIVSLNKLAFGAYDELGNLVYWGPVSGGRDVCPEGNASCNTVAGVFNVFQKKGEQCYSRLFPVDHGGGAPMPYCMFFLDGYAMHGSKQVPGYNASHGCVRMYKEDAEWLNKKFVDVTKSEKDLGTEVVVQSAEIEELSR